MYFFHVNISEAASPNLWNYFILTSFLDQFSSFVCFCVFYFHLINWFSLTKLVLFNTYFFFFFIQLWVCVCVCVYIYIYWRRKWQPTPVFLPGEFHGQRSLAGYSLWGCRESDTTEWIIHICICIYCLSDFSYRLSQNTECSSLLVFFWLVVVLLHI